MQTSKQVAADRLALAIVARRDDNSLQAARRRLALELSRHRPQAVERSLYDGRTWLGSVLQTDSRCFAGYDIEARFLGSFARQQDACRVITASARREASR